MDYARYYIIRCGCQVKLHSLFPSEIPLRQRETNEIREKQLYIVCAIDVNRGKGGRVRAHYEIMLALNEI